VPQSIILMNRGADPARLAANRNQPVTEILKCFVPDDIACKFSIRRRSEDKDRLADWPHGAIRSSNVITLDGRERGGKGERGEVKVWSRVKVTSAS